MENETVNDPDAGRFRFAERAAEAFEMMELIDRIVEGRSPAWHVKIISANPEPSEAVPLHCVTVYGEFPSRAPGFGNSVCWRWQERDFRGDTRLECLRAARRNIEELTAAIAAGRV